MAITKGDIAMWEALTALGVIPPKPHVLEIGQANWWGDAEIPKDCQDECKFVVARLWYAKVLDYATIEAIDFQGADSHRLDLNQPVPWPSEAQFDILINTGTAEHIFDQRQLFETIHERCRVNGLMVHAVPWTGWTDHGFYNYQPCFFADMARANRYETLYDLTWSCGWRKAEDAEVTDNVMLYIALRKRREQPFVVPMQGRYSA